MTAMAAVIILAFAALFVGMAIWDHRMRRRGHRLRRYGDMHKCPVPDLTPGVLEALLAHDWPGNVRELENTLERLVVMSDGGEIKPEMLRFGRPRYALRHAKGNGGEHGHDVTSLIRALVRAGIQTPLPPGLELYDFLVGGLERELIEEVMRQCDGTKVKAADRLGINRNTLHKKWEEYERQDAAATGLAGPAAGGNGAGDER